MNHSKIEKINGKYLNLNINKQTNRIFFEENGNKVNKEVTLEDDMELEWYSM